MFSLWVGWCVWLTQFRWHYTKVRNQFVSEHPWNSEILLLIWCKNKTWITATVTEESVLVKRAPFRVTHLPPRSATPWLHFVGCAMFPSWLGTKVYILFLNYWHLSTCNLPDRSRADLDLRYLNTLFSSWDFVSAFREQTPGLQQYHCSLEDPDLYLWLFIFYF